MADGRLSFEVRKQETPLLLGRFLNDRLQSVPISPSPETLHSSKIYFFFIRWNKRMNRSSMGRTEIVFTRGAFGNRSFATSPPTGDSGKKLPETPDKIWDSAKTGKIRSKH
ncbi:hypothetical protein HNY73_003168 [Argiope bruennichi]|uniref:Uncharacterized protein n=1 Tax=Argiope bruennichi TaxID=94029 RepID=A0A8T0FW47_ARGBR|nr:hypothetical protein HNY73_003168 [Argiope bruennichi]